MQLVRGSPYIETGYLSRLITLNDTLAEFDSGDMWASSAHSELKRGIEVVA